MPSSGASAKSDGGPNQWGVFSDRTSMNRILFAVFNHENRNQGVSSALLLTQTL
jgi:hypothetical protein